MKVRNTYTCYDSFLILFLIFQIYCFQVVSVIINRNGFITQDFSKRISRSKETIHMKIFLTIKSKQFKDRFYGF